MHNSILKKFLSVFLSFSMILTFMIIADERAENFIEANAAVSQDYSPQLMNIATKDNSKVLTENGTADGASLSVKDLGNDLSSSWRFDRVGSNSIGTFFKLVNAQSGRLMTPTEYNVSAGESVVIYGSESHQSQHWYVIPVKSDHLGNDLYYKIVNYSNPSLALTQGTSGMNLTNYTGADNQLWLLNSDGLQGFAGYCSDDNSGNIKAADIGGLFGETVEVTTFDELQKYATSDTPYTIVVTKNISVTELNMNGTRYMCSAGRIYVHSNKTIIGSYNAHTLFNVQFCTSSKSGTGDNIIIKNFEMQHDAESNNNDSIVCYFGSGENIWVDHVSFIGHDNYGYAPKTGLVDEDKFLACCYDADYCTVSDCSFGKHKYGLILGYPSDDENSKNNYDGFPRMTLLSNNFNGCETRAPGLMRWGYFHSFNNYVNKFSMAYTVHSGCDIYAENCYYENGGNVICDWNSITYAGAYAESGSKFSNCNRTVQGQGTSSNPSYSQASTWRPTKNYSYTKLTADEAKSYCNTYSGTTTTKSNMNYLRYAASGVPSANFTSVPVEEWGVTPAAMALDTYYMIKNADSGLYLDVAGAKAENGANVQQWGASEPSVQNTWRFVYAEDGYYYIQSMVGDKTFVMDVTSGKTSNGTNIEIYSYRENDNQKFMIAANSDGTYKIIPKVSDGSAFVEIESSSSASGANCQIWEKTNSDCQNWILEEVAFSGETMDTSVNYMFKNVNSGLYMEVADGSDTDGANVQQWDANGDGENNSGDWNSWTLKSATGDLYYIVSKLAGGRYLTINDGNAEISARDSSSNVQMVRFVKNPDGTYCIVTRTSYNKTTGRYTKVLEVSGASSDFGANVQQWEINGNDCQKWEAVIFTTTTTTTTTTTETTTTTTTTTTSNVTTTSSITTTQIVILEVTVWGDSNNDGDVGIADVVKIMMYASDRESNPIDGQGLVNADVYNHGDGVFVSDALSIQKKLAQVIDSLPESYME